MTQAKQLFKNCKDWPWGQASAPTVAFKIQFRSETIQYDVQHQGNQLRWQNLSFVDAANAFIEMPETVLQFIADTKAKPRAQVARVRSSSHLYLYAFMIIVMFTRSRRNRSI